jgi:hypothetical protein
MGCGGPTKTYAERTVRLPCFLRVSWPLAAAAWRAKPGGLVVAEGVAFDVSSAQPHRERTGEGGLPTAGAADHDDPLGDRFGGRRTSCHLRTVRRRWRRSRQDPAGRQRRQEPGAKQVDGL